MEQETGFEGLDALLGTKFEEKVITNPPAVRSELVEMAEKEKSMEEERSFLAGRIAELMEEAKEVSKILKDDIKIGSKASQYEVYAGLTNTILECIKEMNAITMNKEKMKLEREKFEHKVSKANQPSVNVKASLNLTSADLFKLMENAKKESSLNAVEADFTVVKDEPTDSADLNSSDSSDQH